MDIKQIKKLIDIVRQNGVAELEVKEESESIHIVLNRETSAAVNLPPLGNISVDGNNANALLNMYQSLALAKESNAAESRSNENSASPNSVQPAERATDFAEENLITSPMVGTVYLSSSPDSDVFVKVGDTVRAGDTLCLIEAMKMFNRIEATKDGTVTHILVQNAQSVEYGQRLFVIE